MQRSPVIILILSIITYISLPAWAKDGFPEQEAAALEQSGEVGQLAADDAGPHQVFVVVDQFALGHTDEKTVLIVLGQHLISDGAAVRVIEQEAESAASARSEKDTTEKGL